MYQFLPALIGAALLAAATPSIAQVPTKPPADKKASAAKPAAAKGAAQKADRPRLARSAVKAVEEHTPVDDDPTVTLTEAELEIAKQVYVGAMPCELGATVHVRPARRTGFFLVTTQGHRFLMHPHESRTGAIRLEDPRRGALWLQLGNKSMLMSQKLGRRLADECQSPEQVTYAEALKRNPHPSLLEPLPRHHGMHPHAGMHRGGMAAPPSAPAQPPEAASPPPAADAAAPAPAPAAQ